MPIAMHKQEWDRIVRWADHDKEDPETVRRREYVRYLDATSNAMTKTWPNSLENVNKRNEELRRARLEAAEAKNTNFYKRYVKRKKEEQERLMFSARDIMFKNKDAPKLLLGAVIETCVQKERSEQLKFHERQRQEEAERKRQDDDDIIRKANEWHALIKERKARRFDVNKQHQKEILDQAHEVAERSRIEHETELNLQKLDNMKAQQEMDAIKKFEEDYKAAEKNRIWTDMEKSKQENDARRREQAARDALDDKLIDVLLRSRARVEARRKQTEKDIKQEKMRVLELISQKLESGDAARDAKEQAMLDKAIKEKEAIAEARRKADQNKRDQLLKQRTDMRDQFLRNEQQRLRDINTTRQWDIMNRFKNVELYEDFQENLRNEKARKIKEYREDILKLWKEREDREARELAERRYFYGELAEQKLRHADNKLLTHAAALVEEARAHGRPERPILRTVDRYCKMHRLYPMPELPASLQEHYGRYRPRDTSAPDAGYREPAPPPPDRGPDAPDAPDEPEPGRAEPPGARGRRDGMQLDVKVVPARPEGPPPADYKRAGRANGLQRRPDADDGQLPPLAVPCKTERCHCDLKP